MFIGCVGGWGFGLVIGDLKLFGGGGGGGSLNLLDEVVNVKLFIFILFLFWWGLCVVDCFFIGFLIGILGVVFGFCILVLGLIEVEIWGGWGDEIFLLKR